MGELYKLTFPSGKSYIGITSTTAAERFEKHWLNRKSLHFAISLALRKYGRASVTVETLAMEEDWTLLCAMEIAAIESHGTRAPGGYNMSAGGDGVGVRDELQTERMFAAARRPERLRRISETTRARWSDPDYRARHSASIKAAWNDPEKRGDRLVKHAAMLARRNSDPLVLEQLSERMKGDGNPRARLSIEDVHDIRRRIAAKEALRSIATAYKVHPSTIWLISTGKKWAWLVTPDLAEAA